jgi:hypothetical protein
VVRPHAGGNSSEMGWGGKLKGLGWGFYRHEREDGGLGMSCRGRLDQGAKLGARLPRYCWWGSPWCQQRPWQKNAAAWRLPEGEGARFCGLAEDFPGCWQVHMAGRVQLRHGAPASWPAGNGTGQREKRGGEDDGTYA